MCHSMLGPFAFGPNVNFVVGNNGSKYFFPHLILKKSIRISDPPHLFSKDQYITVDIIYFSPTNQSSTKQPITVNLYPSSLTSL